MSAAGPGGIRICAVACLVLWLLSLLLPAVAVTGGPSLDGLDVLRQGWQALQSGVPSWYANPAFLLACAAALLGWPRSAGLLAGLSVLLALTSFAAPELAARGGRTVPPLSWQAGTYCWLAAQIALLISAVLAVAVHKVSAAQEKLPQMGSFRD